jgi:DNA-binding response OmpR family regulator
MILDKMADQIVTDPPYVLLVESEQPLRERLGKALYASGFVPLLATDAADAVRYMASASVPVLVILDLDLLGEPAELLARFSADARWSRVPVVVTGSAADLPGDLQVDGVLPKPFDAERLVSLGRESIARSR